ncbi:DUF7619 domain-containing protein [Chryseobacterium sp. MIQD13]|uniref:DUF7619 domain-containing protein n=1 Tax=Chryseobacterium sp. MIQD13 TaxID=3422310 RepID=UPI003D28BEB4
MKTKLFCLVSFLMFSLGMKSQNISIPDPNFKAKLLSASSTNTVAKNLTGNYFAIDTNSDGEIQQSEANQVGALYLSNSGINSVNGITGFTNLEMLDINHNTVISLQVNSMASLKWIDASNTNLSDIALGNSIEYLNLKESKVTDLDVSNKSNLSYLNLENNINIANLKANNCNLSTLILNGCTNLRSLDCSYNHLTSLDLQNLNITEQIYYNGSYLVFPRGGVNCSHNNISNLNITNLTTNFLDCSYNNLTSLDTTNLTLLRIPNIALNSPTLPLTVYLNCSHNQLTSIISNDSFVLQSFDCSYNNLTALNINQLTSIEFDCSNNQLTSLNISDVSKIINLNASYNQLTTFVSPALPKISDDLLVNPAIPQSINCNNNLITLLDITKTKAENIFAENNNIINVFAKNGVWNEGLHLLNNPNLYYICADDFSLDPTDPNYDYSEVDYLRDMLNSNNLYPNVNSYCNFVPGGNYNTIKGNVRFDDNNNSCDINDEVFAHMKLKVNNGTSTEETFVKSTGDYNLNTQAGNFTLTAEPENPSLYIVTPSTFIVNFADNNNNITTQDICVTKNGNVKDLEVIFAPVTDARPGFDAVYKVIWRNKGNTALSGNAVVVFNNSKMNFLSSSLPPSVFGNQITFNFTNLKPYSNTSSEITFNVNPPTHPSNPVNIGDQLNFSASVTPLSGDAHPSDNEFAYQQTVTGSFDPNDITCLEGNQIPISMVGKDLHYIINFENTGTAPATNIMVEMDVNPDDFNISSLQLQNTSHGTYTKITGNKVEFMMKDINLAASQHGNITLKIKTKAGLVSGESVSGKANIYFDYNFPVATNEAVTVIGGTVLQTLESNEKSSVNVYPNPTKGDVNIESDSKIRSVEVYDAQGRLIQKQTGINGEKTKISIYTAASGVYYFKVITEKDSFMKKVVKN